MSAIIDYFYVLVNQFLQIYQRTDLYNAVISKQEYFYENINYINFIVLCVSLTLPGFLILASLVLSKSNNIYKSIFVIIFTIFAVYLFFTNSNNFSVLSLYLVIVIFVMLACSFNLIRFIFSVFLLIFSVLSFPFVYSTVANYVYSLFTTPPILPLYYAGFISSLLYSLLALAPIVFAGFYGVVYKNS